MDVFYFQKHRTLHELACHSCTGAVLIFLVLEHVLEHVLLKPAPPDSFSISLPLRFLPVLPKACHSHGPTATVTDFKTCCYTKDVKLKKKKYRSWMNHLELPKVVLCQLFASCPPLWKPHIPDFKKKSSVLTPFEKSAGCLDVRQYCWKQLWRKRGLIKNNANDRGRSTSPIGIFNSDFKVPNKPFQGIKW